MLQDTKSCTFSQNSEELLEAKIGRKQSIYHTLTEALTQVKCERVSTASVGKPALKTMSSGKCQISVREGRKGNVQRTGEDIWKGTADHGLSVTSSTENKVLEDGKGRELGKIMAQNLGDDRNWEHERIPGLLQWVLVPFMTAYSLDFLEEWL